MCVYIIQVGLFFFFFLTKKPATSFFSFSSFFFFFLAKKNQTIFFFLFQIFSFSFQPRRVKQFPSFLLWFFLFIFYFPATNVYEKNAPKKLLKIRVFGVRFVPALRSRRILAITFRSGIGMRSFKILWKADSTNYNFLEGTKVQLYFEDARNTPKPRTLIFALYVQIFIFALGSLF